MKVAFVKLSDQRHRVRVERSDGSHDSVELDSRSFLRHDLAHFAVELELELAAGVWGSVARGGSLSGSGLDGADMDVAETISGPMQTMMRTGADAEEIRDVLARVTPAMGSLELAQRLHARLRSLAGQWAATPYGGDMTLEWPEPRTDTAPRHTLDGPPHSRLRRTDRVGRVRSGGAGVASRTGDR